MTDLLPIAVLTNAIGTLIILSVFLYLYNENRHEHFLIWTVAWAVYFIYNVGSFAEAYMSASPADSGLRLFWRWLAHASAGVSTVLMLWAGRSFAQGYRFHYGYPLAIFLVFIWTTVTVFFIRNFTWLSLPIFISTGIVFIWTGWIFYGRQAEPRLKGTGVLTCAFILWGLHKLDYPFLRPVEAFAPYGYALSTIFGQVAAIGLIILVLEESKRDVRLAEQRALASEKLATIGRMASYVAHEIKNPLSSVNLNLELLADEIADYDVPSKEEAGELLNAIQEELDRLTRNVDEYLRFARLPQLHLHIGDVNVMLESLLQLVEAELEQKHIEIIQDWDYDVFPVQMDTEHLRSVFLNLICNASEAMPDGGKLHISTRQTDGMVLIHVEDTGCGIRDEDLPFIFEPFYTTKASGTGLGLPYVQQIIHQHEGTIHCTSKVGEGSRFTISLPVAR